MLPFRRVWYFTNIPASFKNRADYPGRRTIGLIAENNSYAWVVRWSVNERTLFSVRERYRAATAPFSTIAGATKVKSLTST